MAKWILLTTHPSHGPELPVAGFSCTRYNGGNVVRCPPLPSPLSAVLSDPGVQAKGVDFKVIDDPSIDTTSRTGKLVMGILALIAEFENDIRRERQQMKSPRRRSEEFASGFKQSSPRRW